MNRRGLFAAAAAAIAALVAPVSARARGGWAVFKQGRDGSVVDLRRDDGVVVIPRGEYRVQHNESGVLLVDVKGCRFERCTATADHADNLVGYAPPPASIVIHKGRTVAELVDARG